MQPLVVGHFDLFKLYLPKDLKINPLTGQVSDDESSVLASSISLINQWDELRDIVIRNLKYIRQYGGLIEINTSALRKKLPEPYPGEDLCELVKEYCDGRFVLSDDAHATSQVGVCYAEALNFIINVIKLDRIYYLTEYKNLSIKVEQMDINKFKNHKFWKALQ